MIRTAKVFNISSDLIEGLEDVRVDKIDFYPDKKTIGLLMSGIGSIAPENKFSAVIRHIEEVTGFTCRVLFSDVVREDLGKYLSSLKDFILGKLSSEDKEFSYYDQCDLETSDDNRTLIVRFNSVYAPFIDDAAGERVGKYAVNLVETVFNISMDGSEFTYTDDIPDRMEAPEVPPCEEEPVDDYYTYAPVIPEELLEAAM
ncbi:MAG: hypothetical protein IKT14_05635, partial [Clostridiales bacterium]|nr:hypothetical protein [Clostridiales bacterium]